MRSPTPDSTPRTLLGLATLSILSLLFVGCSSTVPSENNAQGSQNGGQNNTTAVGQGGAQDFGRFRGIVESGSVPAPETLSPVGFFNEHKFDLPKPNCGEDVCLHGMFGVQGNMINGSNCTTVAIGFNTNRTPESVKRPPLNLAIAVDVSGSMAGPPLQNVKSGLEKMVGELEPEDRVTLVAYSDTARVVAESKPNTSDRSELRNAIQGLTTSSSTNLYRGLSTAFEEVEAHATDDLQNRVILLSDGNATDGIDRRERIVNLADSYTNRNYALSTIGLGTDFDVELMRELGRGGANNFYFLEDQSAVKEVFVEEVKTFLVPLAEDVNIQFEGSSAYQFRAAYGVNNWSGDRGSATIDIPALFMASRESSSDTGPGGGRRGGGGIILLELVPTNDQETLENTPPGATVGSISMNYTDPQTGEVVDQTESVKNPLKPDAAPKSGEFSTPTVEKAFVALNIFAGFKMATRRARRGANDAALDILEPLRDNVDEWLDDNQDRDIRADLELMKQLIGLLQERVDQNRRTVQQTPNPNPWPRD